MKERLRLFGATMWLGSLVASALFAMMFFSALERHLAGEAVSHMIRAVTWIGVACAVVLLVTRPPQDARRLVIGMLVCALTIHFGLQPMMAALRAQAAAGTLVADLKTQFGLLHLGSVVFYVAEVVMGVLLLLRVTRR